jgi:hypothetical protein
MLAVVGVALASGPSVGKTITGVPVGSGVTTAPHPLIAQETNNKKEMVLDRIFFGFAFRKPGPDFTD